MNYILFLFSWLFQEMEDCKNWDVGDTIEIFSTYFQNWSQTGNIRSFPLLEKHMLPNDCFFGYEMFQSVNLSK